MTRRTLQIVLAALLLAPTAACRESSEAPIDLGSFENSTYSNQYLGFTITIPTDWDIQTQEAQQALSDLGGEVLAGDDENLAAVFDAAKQSTLNLFAAFKHPPGAPVEFNPNILSVAESVRHLPGIKTGADYLFHAKKLLEQGAMDVSFPRDIERTSLGGREFDILYLEMSISGMIVRQALYVTIIKGYALLFTISYTSDEEAASLKSTLGTVSFDT